MTEFLSLIFMFVLMVLSGCADSTILGDSAKAKPASSETSSDSSGSSVASKDTDGADAPVSVGGAFLVCDKSSVISCALHDENNQKIKFNSESPVSGTVANFAGASVAASFVWQAASSQWHWQVIPSGVAVKDVADIRANVDHLVVTSESSYEISFAQNPIRLGGGGQTILPAGCSQETIDSAVLSGTTYSRSITLSGNQTGVVAVVKKLCGVTDSLSNSISIQNSSGLTIKTLLLPKVATESDEIFTFSGLSAGTYKVVLSSKKADVLGLIHDDFMFTDLTLSQ